MMEKQEAVQRLRKEIFDLLEEASYEAVKLVYIFVEGYLRKSKAHKTR